MYYIYNLYTVHYIIYIYIRVSSPVIAKGWSIKLPIQLVSQNCTAIFCYCCEKLSATNSCRKTRSFALRIWVKTGASKSFTPQHWFLECFILLPTAELLALLCTSSQLSSSPVGDYSMRRRFRVSLKSSRVHPGFSLQIVVSSCPSGKINRRLWRLSFNWRAINFWASKARSDAPAFRHTFSSPAIFEHLSTKPSSALGWNSSWRTMKELPTRRSPARLQ